MKNKNVYLLKNDLSKIRTNIISSSYGAVESNWSGEFVSLPFNKLYLIECGDGEIEVSGTVFHPKKGDFVFIPQGAHHTFSTTSKKPYVKYWCHFNATIKTISLPDYFVLPVIIPASEYTTAARIFKELVINEHNDATNTPFSPILAQAALLEILYCFFQDAIRQIEVKKTNDNIDYQLITYIDENIDQKITITELAKIVHVSPTYLSTYFFGHMGASPIEYINTRRIERAKIMLTEGQKTIEEISASLGFNSPYYFSNTFKKYIGTSPNAYRKSRAESLNL